MHHAVMFEMAYDKQICKETASHEINLESSFKESEIYLVTLWNVDVPSDKLNISIKKIKAELDEKSEHQRIRIYPFRSFKVRFKEELIAL